MAANGSGRRELEPAPSGTAAPFTSKRRRDERRPPSREHVSHAPDAQGWPARCCRPSQSERASRGRPRYSNQPHKKVASRNVTRRRSTRRNSPERGPIGARGAGRGLSVGKLLPLSAPPRGGASRDMLTRGVDKRRDAADSPAKRGGAR